MQIPDSSGTEQIDLSVSARKDGCMTQAMQDKLQRGVALFDFDGTLVPWDSQVLFVDFVLRKEAWRRFYLGLFALLAPCYRVLGDEGMKRVFLSYLWRAQPDQIAAWSREFADEVIRPQLFSGMVERLENHREAGELTVLVSASPDFYIREVGEMLGFDTALGTPVAMRDGMRLFPDLRNHKGAEKVRRTSDLIGAPTGGQWKSSHGYTDSVADMPMMNHCESGTVVNPSPGLERIANDRAWEIVRLPRPWRGKLDKIFRMMRFASGI